MTIKKLSLVAHTFDELSEVLQKAGIDVQKVDLEPLRRVYLAVDEKDYKKRGTESLDRAGVSSLVKSVKQCILTLDKS